MNLNETKLTVSQVNMYIKSLLDSDFRLKRISVIGELSNCKIYYSSGHIYFSIKDEESALAGVMFKSNAQKLKFTPEDGMLVSVTGRIAVYERDGKYQIYAESMEPAGEGALAIAFEQLKKKLSDEGLFDADKKRPIPAFPKKIGVITGEYGAAIQDIFNILGRRYPLAEIVFCPAIVQGSTAACSIISAIKKINSIGGIDVMIVGRGGGSAEDLWCFNDERLVRAVAASAIPVISAVGHETDFTLCDFAADLRAPTPSAAAELAVPDSEELLNLISTLKSRLDKNISSFFTNEGLRLDRYKSIASASGLEAFLDRQMSQNENTVMRLDYAINKFFDFNSSLLSNLCTRLEATSPLRIMARGYSMCMTKEKIVAGIADVNVGDKLTIRVSDGKIGCEVKQKWQK